MKITELLNESGIELGVSVKDKSSAIEILVNLHEKAGNLSDKAEYTQAIKAREEQGSTAVGEGIAIPHAKCSAVKRPGLAAITVPDGVDYEALDGQPSNLFFMIAAPEDGADVHLEVLSRLMVLLMDEDFKNKLLNAKSKQEFLAVIDEKESEKYGDEESLDEKEQREKQIRQNDNNAKYRVLAVTACPTGIAHTYMAAEALQKAGENMGYSLKAETNGSGGVKNALTAEEIEACDGIIVAGMMSVDMGGPVNKAAYVFGTASLATGNFDVMAAVMIGGMVPPIAIALSTTFFKNKWNDEERRNGVVNYIMGLCFISEGAIPYAASDPLRVIPSCIVGSAVAGGLSMAFGCTLRAPHGGVFVFPVVGNWLMYIVALAVGSIVGALILSALKKKVK